MAVEHFLSALNFQAGASRSSGLEKPETKKTSEDLSKVMSENIWSSLRLTLGLSGKRHLYSLIEQRNLDKLNETLSVSR